MALMTSPVCTCSDGPIDVGLSLATATSTVSEHPFHCTGEPDVEIRTECMNAEDLCTTYYLVLLFFSMWTPTLTRDMYL